MSSLTIRSAAVLRFFGMKTDGLTPEIIEQHAQTLLTIPAYSARWMARDQQRDALITQFIDRLNPQPPAPPAAHTPSVPVRDSTELVQDADDEGSVSQGDLFIHYIDAYGSPSARRISVHRIADEGDDFRIRAWCYERQAMRTFLASRIEQAVDMQTGEIIGDVRNWLTFNIAGLDGDGDGQLDLMPDDAFGAVLAVLIYIARADGRMIEAEREVIRQFAVMALRCMNLELLSHSAFDRRIASCSIDFPTFKAALGELAHVSDTMKRGICSVAEAVVLADGKRHRFEMEALHTLREILEL